MPDVHREAVAYRPDGPMTRAARVDWRAPLLLAYVVAGASLVVLSVEPITATLVEWLVGPAPTGMAFELCARLGIGACIMVVALAGFLLSATRPPALALRPTLLTGTAFLAGALAVSLGLAAAGAGGVAAMRPGSGIAVGPFALGTLLILLGVVAEELLLRGLLQPVLVRAWGTAAGVSASALAFVLIHMVGGWGQPMSLVNILLAGLWFGLLALRSGGLAAPILAHFGYNWVEEMIFGASPNPGVGVFGSAIDVDLTGPAIWGGSIEGLNASVVISVVLGALALSLALRRTKTF